MEWLKEFIPFSLEDILFNGSIYAAVSVPAFVVFWVLLRRTFQNRRIQPIRRATWKHIAHELMHSSSTLIVFAMIDFALFKLEKNGYTKIYYDISQYGWGWFVGSIVLMMIVHDAYFYWTHRAMHHPLLYKYFHKVHHESTDPSPFASFAFHPLEALIENGVTVIFAFLMPVHLSALIIWQLLQMILNVIGHLGYELYPHWWVRNPITQWKTPSTHHNMHHELFNGNYGLYFTWWDRWMGTEFKNYTRRFTEIFEAHQPSPNGFYTLRVESITDEPNNAFTITLNNPPLCFKTFLPGQHTTLKVVIDGQEYFRTFSLSSVPGQSDEVKLTIKRVPGGKVTNYLYDHLKQDDLLELTAPSGRFTVQIDPASSKHYVMIAGGSGITPIYSMIATILYAEHKSRITLFYANRTRSSIIFATMLEELRRTFPHRFAIRYFISDELIDDLNSREYSPEQSVALHSMGHQYRTNADGMLVGGNGSQDSFGSTQYQYRNTQTQPESPEYVQGYITQKPLEEIIQRESRQENLRFYCCGPSVMIEEIVHRLQYLGITSAHIHREIFTISSPTTTAPVHSTPTATVLATIDGKEYRFVTAHAEPILTAALSGGIPMRHSCQSGLCGMCAMKCTRGHVIMKNNQVLSENDIKAGHVLTCQSLAQTNEVHLVSI